MAINNVEKEIRFFLPTTKLKEISNLINQDAEFKGRFYELTVMYDNPNPDFSFYPKEVDGRLRFRTSIFKPLEWQEKLSNEPQNGSKITWKRRLPKTSDSKIVTEEEIEVSVDYNHYQNMEKIFEDVLKCKRISSYERYRNSYGFNGLSITIDEFPYGLMLEVEIEDGSEQNLLRYIDMLNINIDDSYPLSCDDKYIELCKDSNLTAKNDILFNDPEMPQIR